VGSKSGFAERKCFGWSAGEKRENNQNECPCLQRLYEPTVRWQRLLTRTHRTQLVDNARAGDASERRERLLDCRPHISILSMETSLRSDPSGPVQNKSVRLKECKNAIVEVPSC
jgi:hypothetical protein